MLRVLAISVAGLLGLGCSRAPSPPDPPAHASADEAAPPAGPSGVEPPAGGLLAVDTPGAVGILRENRPRDATRPSEYCLDDGLHYAGAPARVGRVNVFATGFEPLVGEPVLVRGRREGSLLSALTKLGPCPAPAPEEHAQMRSDWVSPEGGFRTTRARLENVSYFTEVTLTAVDLGGAISSDDAVTIFELRNPFAAPLDGLAARAHYEGGPGKPMPHFASIALRLPPGGRQRIEVPTSVERDPAGRGDARGAYRLQSLDLEGQVGAIEVDVSLPRARGE